MYFESNISKLANLVITNNISSFDTSIYNFFTRNMNNTLTSIYKAITFLGSTPFIVGLVIFFVILFIIIKKKNTAFSVAGVLIISTIVNNLVKIIIRRNRPLVLALVTEKSFSYPSGHTMASVSMYYLLIFIILKTKWNKYLKVSLCFVLAILPIVIAASRIYLGAHFASDVIAAFITSSILLLVECYYIDKYKLI